MLARLECYVDASDLAVDYVDLVNPSIGENGQVWPPDLAVDNVVKVSSELSDSRA